MVFGAISDLKRHVDYHHTPEKVPIPVESVEAMVVKRFMAQVMEHNLDIMEEIVNM